MASMALALDPASLSLSTGLGVQGPGKDVLSCWPHEYNSRRENTSWAKSLDWDGTCGQHGTTLYNCGYEQYAMNYAFDAMFPHIPSGTERRNPKVLLFKAEGTADRLAKQRNFHAAMGYIQHYPAQYNTALQRTLGVSKGLFVQQVIPTLLSVAEHMEFLKFNLRYWEWNHT